MLCFDPDKRLRMHEVMPRPCLGLCDAKGHSSCLLRLWCSQLTSPTHWLLTPPTPPQGPAS